MNMPNDPWEQARERLLALGWTPETAEVGDALRSPNNSCLVAREEVLDSERRRVRIEHLKRQIATIQHRPLTNMPPGWKEKVLPEFRQLLDCLERLNGE
jgi:hypothetical protein